jgi:drug/metabolite transporter (DMT)-like permease
MNQPSLPATQPRSPAWLAFAPALFVLLWSTGFVGAKYGLPYAPPWTFLAIRLVIVAALLALWALLRRERWPRSWAQVGHIALVGLLLHGVYLGGVYLAFSWGLEAGTSAVIVSIQPLLVAALAGPLLKERVTRQQWLGLVLGLVGVTVVVWRKAGLSAESFHAALLCLVALFAITAALLYQKRFLAGMPLVASNALQFAAAALFTVLAACLFEDWQVQWTWEFVFAMTWLVLVLSIGAVGLLLLLIRRGAATRVASLFFLVPPTVALMSWPILGETLGWAELAGMALVMLGVALVNRRTA